MTIQEYRELKSDHANNVLRNTLVSLDQFRFVEIQWEKDIHMTNATGESCGEWRVEIHTHDRREIVKKGDYLEELLIAADDEAAEANSAFWKQREHAREVALSKLSLEDRKALNLR